MTPAAATLAQLVERERSAHLPVYPRQPVGFTRGSGPWLFDTEERAYLDFFAGLAVASLGHAHPDVADAVADQAARLVHTSNLYYTEGQIELAERLKATLGWPDGRTFLCNSGAEANEAALKLARRHGKASRPEKVGVVALDGGFHGRTLATLAATGNPAKREPFAPLGDWVTHVHRDDPGSLDMAVTDDTCAVLVEIVQGEGGVHEVPDETLRAARAACDRTGALLLVDEVQTGLGRLGTWYGWQQSPVIPDVVCLAKALANGLPIGAIVARGPAGEAFTTGDHATTFGGGPVVCAAALAVLETLERDGLVAGAATRGQQLREVLDDLVADHDVATGVRGRGLLQALTLAEPVSGDVVAACLNEGLIVNAVAADTIRLCPPLTIGEAELESAAERLDAALHAVAAGTVSG